MVTRSLVSYDLTNEVPVISPGLNGHQIIGELRLTIWLVQQQDLTLNGHQIIGELRPRKLIDRFDPYILNGHQIIGELRHTALGAWGLYS